MAIKTVLLAKEEKDQWKKNTVHRIDPCKYIQLISDKGVKTNKQTNKKHSGAKNLLNKWC